MEVNPACRGGAAFFVGPTDTVIIPDGYFHKVWNESETEDLEDISVVPTTEIPDSLEFYKNYEAHSQKKITDPCLTKYEKTKILAERTQQIENGALMYIPLTDKLTTAYSIA